MSDLEVIFNILLICFGIAYLIIISQYTFGWYRLKYFTSDNRQFSTKVSIIIPARNEEDNIQNLLIDLIRQDFPTELYEIIVADDNSDDKTADITSRVISEYPDYQLKLITISDHHPAGAYKKKAIMEAIRVSSGELIITTDADCRMHTKWLSSMISYYESEKPKMIVGPVSFHNERSYFEKMQTLEFLSLIAITGGAIKIGRPIMCNGANLAYEKKAFYEVGGFGTDSLASGDDVFMLLKIRKHYGSNAVRFIKNNEAIVFTEAKKTIREFFHQRTRWASKNKVYDLNILVISFSVYMVNLLLFGGLIISLFIHPLLPLILISFLVKLLVDLPVLIGIVKFAGRGRMFLYSFPLLLVYPAYIIFTGAMGMVATYQWKGRKTR